MDFIKVIFLAIAQGIAEFLPISSSGHLLVLGDWLGFDYESNMQLNVILHAVTGIPNLNAVLPPLAGVILVGISMLLTFIAGLFPAKVAAKKDPVIALRSE